MEDLRRDFTEACGKRLIWNRFQGVINRMKSLTLFLALIFGLASFSLAQRGKPPPPDFTKGGKIDAKKHDWNLGPTGARGWIWGWKLQTTDARQIYITKIDKGSPADGHLENGDVILGVGGKPFSADVRKVLGRAINDAEANRGQLSLTRWRDGKTEEVVLKLPVLGRFGPFSPYKCAKAKTILEAGCKAITSRKLKGGIDGKINALALLASGKPEYKTIVRDYVRALAPEDLELKLHSRSGMASWHWGYTNLLLTEYHLATGDKAVLPAIREYTTKIATGQSAVGTWGHGMAWPDWNEGKVGRRLGGYGALNQAGLVCHLSLVLGKMCGVKDPVVDKAIEKANEFFGFYIDKGAIPYGDHRPGWKEHDDNGKNSIAAIIFDLQKIRYGVRFFSRMTVASYGERERGHTGNYFSYLWGPLGAHRAGGEAAAAFLKEQQWFYDLNRKWDGTFPYQGGAASTGGEHKYGNWDCTGAFILAHALPLRKLYITGRGLDERNKLTGAALKDTIEAGRQFSSWDMGIDVYRAKPVDALLENLESWSPAVRYRAATALSEKKGDHLQKLVAMLDSNEMLARYGACQALGAMKSKAAEAVPALQAILWEKDIWLRIQATYALSHIGAPAKRAVPDLLKLASMEYLGDPRQMVQRYLAFGLFYRGGALGGPGLIARSLADVDRKLLYKAVEKMLGNPDGRARGAVASVYKNLTYDELKPILPAVYEAIVEPSPSGVMFASGIRIRGVEMLAEHRVEEGMSLCLDIMDIDKWGKRSRITQCLKVLGKYGGAAKPMVPRLRELEQQLLAHREARGLQPQIEQLRKTIAKIESGDSGPELRKLF